MTKRPRAGGFFLVAPIIAGFLYGLTAGRVMEWTFIGLVTGLVAALALWLFDRRRP